MVFLLNGFEGETSPVGSASPRGLKINKQVNKQVNKQ
jgi:hypothetical protein